MQAKDQLMVADKELAELELYYQRKKEQLKGKIKQLTKNGGFEDLLSSFGLSKEQLHSYDVANSILALKRVEFVIFCYENIDDEDSASLIKDLSLTMDKGLVEDLLPFLKRNPSNFNGFNIKKKFLQKKIRKAFKISDNYQDAFEFYLEEEGYKFSVTLGSKAEKLTSYSLLLKSFLDLIQELKVCVKFSNSTKYLLKIDKKINLAEIQLENGKVKATVSLDDNFLLSCYRNLSGEKK